MKTVVVIGHVSGRQLGAAIGAALAGAGDQVLIVGGEVPLLERKMSSISLENLVAPATPPRERSASTRSRDLPKARNAFHPGRGQYKVR